MDGGQEAGVHGAQPEGDDEGAKGDVGGHQEPTERVAGDDFLDKSHEKVLHDDEDE